MAHSPILHVGKLIQFIIVKNNVDEKALCKELKISKSTLHKIYERESVQFSLLTKLSIALHYNLIVDFGQLINNEIKKPV